MAEFFKSLIAIFQFFTIVPLGKNLDFELYTRHFYLIPFVGYFVGIIAAVVAYFMPSHELSAAACIAAVMIMYGFNHFDGLLDMGDGLMAHGSREKRVKALTDQNIGAGGVATGMLVILMTYTGLLSVPSIPVAIIAAEVTAKFSQVLFLTYGKPFRDGIFSYTHSFAKKWFPLASVIICLPLLLLPLGITGFAGIVCALLLSFCVLYYLSGRLFGGINGDVTGAANEITRLVVIIALAFF
ncbi:adenosylcobinamide-GDP ribazoletransferase [Methanomicrobium sp. W14]|uniref:adenosylcobinamide-GDP ribazoletransferase n=1 Tax=Methanomicrobium sp. W14 TaxID=2817839 RepID=UPI001AE86202|nr:adenosylcobinamide-GDP ribazoletransferase [Methanomicrobium sp. W14]MBP2133898.1 adenosylcobinamide-GDP ribazoletransferase [Methanomicrobium sp. W14]